MQPSPPNQPAKQDMKLKVARTIKWNVIDKVASQLLYAVTGVVLARLLSQEDFGLVGAVLVFQAFASLFVDSGFSSALIQRKRPTRLDYSTVLWFNMAMAVGIYLILFICAPLIADCFQGDQRLIPLSRVMLLTFILNASAIVQTNRLVKRMEVKMVAVSNSIGLVVAAGVGISLAVAGYGAWAIVWQSIALAAVKSGILWATGRWLPLLRFSWQSLRSFFSVGMGVMLSSLLNTIFQNIYSFFVGNRAGLASLGYYTQADKWSKMGISSMSAVLTSSFLPVLSEYQDSPQQFAASTSKMHRLTAYLLFPAFGLLAVMATPIFHLLFGQKWDAAIPLFQLLLLRGVFTVLTSLYANIITALGHSRKLVVTEAVRDAVAIAALVATLPWIACGTPEDPCMGLRWMLWGQVAAAVVAWIYTLVIVGKLSWRTPLQYLADLLPYLLIAALSLVPALLLPWVVSSPALLIPAQTAATAALYLLVCRMLGSRVQADALAYVRRKL